MLGQPVFFFFPQKRKNKGVERKNNNISFEVRHTAGYGGGGYSSYSTA